MEKIHVIILALIEIAVLIVFGTSVRFKKPEGHSDSEIK